MHEKQSFNEPQNSQLFMESEVSLPCSEEHTTGFHPQQDESRPHTHTLFP
jgi:hypothetical protein